jgi:hypothetical protein
MKIWLRFNGKQLRYIWAKQPVIRRKKVLTDMAACNAIYCTS